MKDPIRKLAQTIYEAARDVKAQKLVVLNISSLSVVADYLVIASGTSNRQVKAIVDRVQALVKKKLKKSARGIEGAAEARWALVDYGDVVVHVFQEEAREFYRLDNLWHDAKRVRFPAKKSTPKRKKAS